jgi:hypothetical protein
VPTAQPKALRGVNLMGRCVGVKFTSTPMILGDYTRIVWKEGGVVLVEGYEFLISFCSKLTDFELRQY